MGAAAMIIGNSGYTPILSQSKTIENKLDVAAFAGNNLPVQNPSADSVQISDAAKAKMFQKTSDFVDVTGEHGMYKLGLMALGESTLQEWSAKGLEVSNEAVIAAGKAFQDGFKSMVERSDSSLAGSSLALNKHQILINTQDVPEWFTREYENTLAVQTNKQMKDAFEKGELSYTSKPSSSKNQALASYARVAKNI